MTVQNEPREKKMNPRNGAGITGGYIGLFFGGLAVLSAASEVSNPGLDLAALMVLVSMVGGYVMGWLVQPLIARLFPQA